MGVGKTTACRQLQQLLDRSVFLDGDWCWDAHPFQVTEETREMVLENIAFLLNSFLRCSAYDHVIFCWVLHRREIWADLLRRLTEPYALCAVSLTCTPEALRSRLAGDIRAGVRQPERRETVLNAAGQEHVRMRLRQARNNFRICSTSPGSVVSLRSRSRPVFRCRTSSI